MNIPQGWLLDILPACSSISEEMEALGVCPANAAEKNRKLAIKDLSRNFVGAESLLESGVQVLRASGRRPDCAAEDPINVRLLHCAAGFAFPTSKDARF